MRVEDLSDPESEVRCLRHPFITNNIAGYIQDKFEDENDDGEPQHAMIRVYDTETGEYLASAKMPHQEAKSVEKKYINVKANLICYSYKEAIHIFRVVEGEVKEYEIPVGHLGPV